jgi:hypothetical protein
MCLQACPLCKTEITLHFADGIVQYECLHIEHEKCFFDNHPHNTTCVVCGLVSNVLMFK